MPLPPKILWKRTSKSESLSRGHKYYFSQSRADHAVGFFEQFLTHSKGQFAGQPFTLLDWQREEVIEELFGWLRVDNDYRRYRQGYICLPKKMANPRCCRESDCTYSSATTSRPPRCMAVRHRETRLRLLPSRCSSSYVRPRFCLAG